jgi:hypothetical protein
MRIPKLIFGILFVFAGLIFTYFELYQFLFFTPLGVILLSHNSGLELDFENQKYRQYSSFFGKKKGEWLSLASYTALIILRKDGKTNLVATRSTFSSTLRYNEYQVFFTDLTHRKRLYLKHFDTHEQAKIFALDFMEKTGIPLERFDPVISQQTRNRR